MKYPDKLNGVVSTDINFQNYFDEVIDNNDNKIDAIYIPTHGKRIKLYERANKLAISGINTYIICSKENINHNFLHDDVTVLDFTSKIHRSFLFSHISSNNPSILQLPNYDIPSKRNFAIEHSKKKNYKRIGLIDDDITITLNQIIKAGIMLDKATLVGYYSLFFPDKSTISLIECMVKDIEPRVSLSGNCLFMDLSKAKGFFPFVYNEDWLFILNNFSTNNSVIGIGIVEQDYHEPWKNHQRIKFEQFGDCIAYAMRKFSSLKNNITSEIKFWENAYCLNQQRLKSIQIDAERLGYFNKEVQIAIKEIHNFTPVELASFCQHYLNDLNKYL